MRQLFLFRNLWRCPNRHHQHRPRLAHPPYWSTFDGQKRLKKSCKTRSGTSGGPCEINIWDATSTVFEYRGEDRGTESLGLLENHLRFGIRLMMRHWSREKHGSKQRLGQDVPPPLESRPGKVDRVTGEDGSLKSSTTRRARPRAAAYYRMSCENELREGAVQLRVYAWMLSRRDGGADVSALGCSI